MSDDPHAPEKRRGPGALRPGTLLTNEIWGSTTTAIVLRRVRIHGIHLYEILINYPPDQDLQGGLQHWRAEDILQAFEVVNDPG